MTAPVKGEPPRLSDEEMRAALLGLMGPIIRTIHGKEAGRFIGLLERMGRREMEELYGRFQWPDGAAPGKDKDEESENTGKEGPGAEGTAGVP